MQIEQYGVDVNSGCKNEFGIKDKNKVKSFVYNAKQFEKELSVN